MRLTQVVVPQIFKVLYKIFMKSVQIFNKKLKVPPVNSEVLVQLENIESPVTGHISYTLHRSSEDRLISCT
jgi:hypothetical protein